MTERQECPADDPVGPTQDPMAYTWDGRRRTWVLSDYYHAWARAHAGWPIERK